MQGFTNRKKTPLELQQLTPSAHAGIIQIVQDGKILDQARYERVLEQNPELGTLEFWRGEPSRSTPLLPHAPAFGVDNTKRSSRQRANRILRFSPKAQA